MSLLDRFLACMKPASITLRPLRAGVFFGGYGILSGNKVVLISPYFADAAWYIALAMELRSIGA
ncbi:MAG: hypothetical protein ACRBBQ_08610 [Cognatishimia sp.]